ncbi:MAG: carboxymuconolactone decarboxylase family protein [Gammaproteobacteria bacterium]
MTRFALHTVETAPEAARPLLQGIHNKLGFVPNLYAFLAESPAALGAYLTLSDRLGETSFTPTEQQVLALAVSAANRCGYCMAAHSTIARHMVQVPGAIVDALREGQRLDDARLEALRRFAEAVVADRGEVLGPPLESFLAAGFSHQQVIEVVLGVAMKTLSNYANHLFDTPIDAAFKEETWPRL